MNRFSKIITIRILSFKGFDGVNELVWLYYNGLSDYGVENLKPLIERYAMLKNLRDDLLVDGVDVGSYTESAYGKTIPDEELVAQQ